MAMIEARDLTIGYTKPLMEHLNFDIERGDVFLVLGGSGTGKSTMLRTMIGLQPPLGGSVELEGVGDPSLLDGKRPRFGVSFQAGALFGSMTIAQNVALPLEQWTDLDDATIEGIVAGKLRLVGLEQAANHLPSELSGGMLKRAGIARALALENDLLFLDEPSAGLDPVTASELDDLLLTLNRALGPDPRRRDPRTREHLSHRYALLPPRPRHARHHRRGRPPRPPRREHGPKGARVLPSGICGRRGDRMSVNRSNEWKVGAFVVGGVIAAVATLFWLGAARFNSETIERVTFLDESVQGLEVGAPVKVRGVTIGKVTDIRLAKDRRLVEVHASLRVEAMRSLNVLDSDEQADGELPDVPMDLRFTMASQGITGIKFLEADFFPETAPMIHIPFDPPPGFVPATPSTLKSLEDALRGLAEEVPMALSDFRRLTMTVDSKLTAIDAERLSSSISKAAEDLSVTLDRADPSKLMGETEAAGPGAADVRRGPGRRARQAHRHRGRRREGSRGLPVLDRGRADARWRRGRCPQVHRDHAP